jgi:hypothetical protein
MFEAKLSGGIVEMLSEFPPEIAYACAKTGLLLSNEQLECYSPEAIAEWRARLTSTSGWRSRARRENSERGAWSPGGNHTRQREGRTDEADVYPSPICFCVLG